jgi:AMMECR1 domain-containing protein
MIGRSYGTALSERLGRAGCAMTGRLGRTAPATIERCGRAGDGRGAAIRHNARATAIPSPPFIGLIVLLLALAQALACAPARAAAPDPALAPYSALARSGGGARLLALARAALEAHWSGAAPDTSGAPDWPAAPVALYLSLVRADGATRACVGSPQPAEGSLAECVRALAAAATAADRRRPALRRDEVAVLRVVLAFAGRAEPLADPMRVAPTREGLLVRGAGGAVAFLPGEARTIAWALREARRAGVVDGAGAEYGRFEVVTMTESVRRAPARRAASAGGDPDEDESH